MERTMGGCAVPKWGANGAHFLAAYVPICYDAIKQQFEAKADEFVARRQYGSYRIPPQCVGAVTGYVCCDCML